MVAVENLLHIYTSIHTLPRCLRVHCDPITRCLLFYLIPSTNEHLLSASLRKAKYFVTSWQELTGLQEWCDEWATTSSTSGELGIIESNAEEVGGCGRP